MLTKLAMQISVSEDVDAQINQDALAALKQLLEIQPQLHHSLFTETEHQIGSYTHLNSKSSQVLIPLLIIMVAKGAGRHFQCLVI